MKTIINASVKMHPALHARVVSLAEIRKRTAHAIMIQAIESYVDREEKREAWRQEGIAAWEHYQRTGLHLTQEELETWAAKISQGERVPMPKCHI